MTRIIKERITVDKFMKKVYPEPNTGCWLWGGLSNMKGYGVMTKKLSDGRKVIGAHRVSYYLFKGPFDYKLCVCHQCDNPSCVNPDHLFLDTVFGNNEDMVKKGRSCKGEARPGARLTEIQVREIRAKYATGQYTYRELAKEYKMHDVNHVINGKGWRHIL